MRNWAAKLAAFFSLFCCALNAAPKHRVIVLVIDGLRPDFIRSDFMPNLARLKGEGAWFEHSHSLFPTVTRVNSAGISTGSTPGTHGIVSNMLYAPAVGPSAFDTADYENLLKLAAVSGGRTVPVPTLAEVLTAKGLSFVALTSGSTGSGFLLNPEAPKGVETFIALGLEKGARVAFPDKVNQEILSQFGKTQAEAGVTSILWTEKVVREYVLPKLRPDVMIDWITEPDSTQHRAGVGSPEALAALKAVDGQIGLLIEQLRASEEGRATDLIVTADHGFSATPDPVDVSSAVEAAGGAAKVTFVTQQAAGLFYVAGHDARTIQTLVEQLQRNAGVDVVFTAAEKPGLDGVHCHAGKELGWVQGTFSLEVVGQCGFRGADVMVSFHWSSDNNEFGFPGVQQVTNADKREHVPKRSGHGGLNAWMVHTPLLFWGPDFRAHTVIESPAANSDIAPTILALEGIERPASMTGRGISEAFSASKANPKPQTRAIRATAAGFCGEIRVSTMDGRTYVDQGARCP